MGVARLEIIDTHTHLATAAFAEDLSHVLSRGEAAGVSAFVAIGASEGLASNRAAVNLAATHPSVVATLGIHPHEAGIFSPGIGEEIQHLLKTSAKVKAIGEIGLDFHYMHASKEEQMIAFEAQFQLAHDHNLPVVIHSREAEKETLQVIEKWRSKVKAVNVHCFTGSQDFADGLRDLDCYMGVGGILTFKAAHPLRQVVSTYPDHRILLETDCPYLAPIPHRGKRNEPGFLPLVLTCLAGIKGRPPEYVAEATSANARGFFGF